MCHSDLHSVTDVGEHMHPVSVTHTHTREGRRVMVAMTETLTDPHKYATMPTPGLTLRTHTRSGVEQLQQCSGSLAST